MRLAALVLTLLAVLLLAMGDSSDEEEMLRAISEAQARARASMPPAEAEPADESTEARGLFDALPADFNGTLLGAAAGAPRKTCKKDKLAGMCPRCSNPQSKEVCAYKTGEWDPPRAPTANGTTAEPHTSER